MSFDAARAAKRRRPLEKMERRAIRLFLKTGDEDARRVLDAVRYALCFAKLIAVDNDEGVVDTAGPLARHATELQDLLGPRLDEASSIWELSRVLPDIVARTRRSRDGLLEHLPIPRDALEAEVTTRQLVIASGGGGGAGYVYPGSYEAVERLGIVPALMVGTSIGSLMSLFRARRRIWDFAPLVGAARDLSWTNTFSILDVSNRYGLPATLRLYLRRAIGRWFMRDDGEPMRLSDMEIPLFVMTTGIRVEALKHDLDYYEHLMDESVSGRGRRGVRGGLKAVSVLREFLATPEALEPVVLGRDEGTKEFDALDAAGFSAAIPAVIHYDVLRDDPRMHKILDHLYALRGITRLGEGGMVHNVPARVAWEEVVSGRLGGVRNSFVLALDCFAPNPRRIAWLPFQQAVRTANVDADRKYTDAYVVYPRVLSPMNLVPSTHDALTAVRWGRDAMAEHNGLIREAMREIPVL